MRDKRDLKKYRLASASCIISNVRHYGFYSASALLAMQTVVIDRAIMPVRPSVRHIPVFFHTNKASGRKTVLVSGEVKLIQIFAGDHPGEGVEVKRPHR